MNVPLIAAGALGVVAAAIHGGAGEVLVLRKLSLEVLPSTPFGGPRMTKAMIHVTWHIATSAFLAVGVALALSGAILDGDTARGIGLVGASAFTGFAVVAIALGVANTRSLKAMTRHLGPGVLTATAGIAWWGALSV